MVERGASGDLACLRALHQRQRQRQRCPFHIPRQLPRALLYRYRSTAADSSPPPLHRTTAAAVLESRLSFAPPTLLSALLSPCEFAAAPVNFARYVCPSTSSILACRLLRSVSPPADHRVSLRALRPLADAACARARGQLRRRIQLQTLECLYKFC